MLDKAYLRLRKSKIFWEWECPQIPLDDLHLHRSTRLSQNPSYGPDLLSYDVYLLVKPCIYILAAAVIETCRLELLQVSREICPPPPQLHILKRGPELHYFSSDRFSLSHGQISCHFWVTVSPTCTFESLLTTKCDSLVL